MSYWGCSFPHRKCRDAQRIVPLLYLAQVVALHKLHCAALGSAYFVFRLSVCIPLPALKQPEGRQQRGHDENIGIFIILNQARDLRY